MLPSSGRRRPQHPSSARCGTAGTSLLGFAPSEGGAPAAGGVHRGVRSQLALLAAFWSGAVLFAAAVAFAAARS
jgi:hypothetical protein